MSNEIACSKPATAAARAAPTTPAAGPESSANAGCAAASVRRGHAARGAHHQRLGHICSRARAREAPQVAGEHRAEVRVDRGRRGALVLAELRCYLVRGDDVRARHPAPQLGRDRPLVVGPVEREEQAHGYGLRLDLGQRLEVERLEHAVRADALAHAEAALERHERLGMARAEAVEVRAILAAR